MAVKIQTGRLVSIKQACELLGGVSESSVRLWLRQGKLTRIKIGRLTRVCETELLALAKPVGGHHDRRS